MAGSVVLVVRQKAQVFIRVLGLFQAFAFHPFIEQPARILKSIKLKEFLGTKSQASKFAANVLLNERSHPLSFHMG